MWQKGQLMKKNILVFLVITLLSGLCACGKEEHYGIEAKTISFEELQEMEDYSDVIVKGIRTGQEEPVIIKENEIFISGYTFSKFQISEIYKDNTDTLSTNSVITILENEIYDEEENIVYHIAGYNMMEEGKEYLLFLNKDTLNGSDYYVTAGVNYGTVSLEEDDRMTARSMENGNKITDFSEYEKIWQEAKNKYK